MAQPAKSVVSGFVRKVGAHERQDVFIVEQGSKRIHCVAPTTYFIKDGDRLTFIVEGYIKPSHGTFAKLILHEVGSKRKIEMIDTPDVIVELATSVLRDEVQARAHVVEAIENASVENIDLRHYLDYNCVEYSTEAFYAWWLSDRLYRRLWHLGLYTQQVDELCKYFRCDVGHLYDKLITHPLHAVPLDQNTALILCAKFGVTATLEEKTIGAIARDIYRMTWSDKHTYVTTSTLYKIWPAAKRYLKELERDYELVTYNFKTIAGVEKEIVQFRYVEEAEIYIAQFVGEFVDKSPVEIDDDELEKYISDDVYADEAQRAAVMGAQRSRLTLWIGGPGRGKTRAIKEVVNSLLARKENVTLASFTGAAVRCMRRVIGEDTIKKHAKSLQIATINTLIQRAGGMYGARKPTTSLGYLILDEGSMISSGLIFEFFTIYRKHIESLLIVGDENQLQPTDWGTCFKQLILSNTIKTYHFIHNYRAINDVYCVDENKNIANTEHCELMGGNIDTVLACYKATLNAGCGYKNVIVLTPKVDAASTINIMCQEYRVGLMQTPPECVTDAAGCKFYEGDQVILKRNLKNKDYNNGDIGVVKSVSQRGRKVWVEFDAGELVFSLSTNANEKDYSHYSRAGTMPTTSVLLLAYCITVHSFQGAERDHVLFYIPNSDLHINFFNFYLINTAMSRARESMAVIGNLSLLHKNFRLLPPRRNETLASRIHYLRLGGE